MTSQKLNLRNYKSRKDNPTEQDENCPFAKIQLVRTNLAVTYDLIMLRWFHTNSSKIQVNFRISIEASEHSVAYISPPICFNQLNFGFHLVLSKIYLGQSHNFTNSNFCDVTLHYTLHCQRWIQKIKKRGGRNTCQLCRYFFFFWEIYKNNTKFQRKRGGCGPLGPPLNPPLIVIVQGHVLGSRMIFFFPPSSACERFIHWYFARLLPNGHPVARSLYDLLKGD